MSNRRVKSLDYDEDDFDDYEDFDGANAEDELSAEDKEQLRTGTAKVKEALGSTYTVSEKEIQDTLWHYYYDVSRSVSYLKNVHKPKAAARSKTTELQAFFHDDCVTSRSLRNFFADCPWLQVPEHRRMKINVEPQYPRGRLLGGSSKDSKISKLAALAAKRRQKENDSPSNILEQEQLSTDDYTTNLSKLTLASNLQSQRKAAAKQAEQVASAPQMLSNEKDRDANNQSDIDPIMSTVQEPQTLIQRAEPSVFARTMLKISTSPAMPLDKTRLKNELDRTFDFSQPSPDDVISNAQSGKATLGAKSTAKATAKIKADVINGIEALKIQESVKIKSKNIDVISEFRKINKKKAANFVVVGHVDAGKSTLMGRLLFDLHAIDERTMEKYQKEADRIGKGSFAFAWVLDQGSEERERGVTIDIATNQFETEKTSFTILDAPGHQDFVPNMIAGASQADFAVLVIDASGSNFESGLRGQTKEHALLVRSIGVQRIIVAINKMDTIHWNQERFSDIEQQMSAFLAMAGFQSKNIAFIPCTGLQGDNILKRVTDPRASWYSGNTLVEELDAFEAVTYSLEKPLRITIADVFRGSIQNPLSISGRVETGTIQVGESVLIMPSAEQASVRSLEADNEPQEWAVAGQNVILNLTDVDPIHLKTGDVVCSSTSPVKNTDSFTAKILAFTTLMPQLVDLHRGRLHVPGRISQLLATLDKTTGTEIKKKPKVVQPNTVVRVSVKVDVPVSLEAGQRIVFRAGGDTVAAGIIE